MQLQKQDHTYFHTVEEKHALKFFHIYIEKDFYYFCLHFCIKVMIS